MAKQAVAVIGASNNPAKYGFKAVRAYVKQGWDVYPVNSHADSIEGLKVYASVQDIPVDLDRVTIYLQPETLLEVLPEIAKKGTKDLFLNPGSESEEVVAKAKELGLNPILACSIVEIGVSPQEV